MRIRLLVGALALVLPIVSIPTAPALSGDNSNNNQIEDNLSSYTGVNAEGYLGPLRDAIGSSLNSGLFMYAGVPRSGFHARLDFRGMLVSFGADDRTFEGVTEDFFGQQQSETVPTVVGDERAVLVSNPSTGATFTFPGGFNIDRFAMAVPQLTVGSVMGTEVMARYIAVETGDAELGDISLTGFGARHDLAGDLSQSPSLDMTLIGFWQKLKVGQDFVEAKTLTLGGQVGKKFSILGVYAGLTYDSVSMDVSYDTDTGGGSKTVDIGFDSKSTAHFTLGGTLGLGFLHLNGEFNQGNQSSLAFGLGLGL